MRLYIRFALLLSLTTFMLTVVHKGGIHFGSVVNKVPPKYKFKQDFLRKELLSHLKRLWEPKIWVTGASNKFQAIMKPYAPWDVNTMTCTPNHNVTKAKWFKGLEPKFKQYVLYRHCQQFRMILNHPEKCQGDIHLLIIIKSIITQHDRRELIRKTWGKEHDVDGKKVRTLFLLGAASKDKEMVNHQKLLEYEDKLFGDILQWDFLDSFYNLTLKETQFLKWFSKYCHKVQYIFKGDDDIFVNIPNLLDYLKESNSMNLFAGDVMFKAKPIRNKTNKYYIPRELYSNSLYPPYAGGGGFVMDSQIARKLYDACKGVELFPIDDVFLGMCLKKLHVKPIKHNAFKTFGLVRNKTSRLNLEPCFFKSMIVVHKLLPPDLVKMWRKINSKLVCTQTYNFA